jgi:hypothetical protein
MDISEERIHGGLCLWTRKGRSFHSTRAPSGLEPVPSDAPLLIETQPRSAAEMRLMDTMSDVSQFCS